MRVLIAPDSFKGTLNAIAVSDAVHAGWSRVRPQDTIVRCPVSDGGDGLIDAIEHARGGRRHQATVAGPLLQPCLAEWLVADGGTAVVETAQACGLHLVDLRSYRPREGSTYGVGQLIERAANDCTDRLLVGLGGSATVDGGSGLLAALGAELLDHNGRRILRPRARDLHSVRSFRLARAERWLDVPITLLSDVTTPLYESAARFGPQKGACAGEVRELTDWLARWALVVETGTGQMAVDLATGSGAAGGLGFALQILGARMAPGAELVLNQVEFEARLSEADLVLTGEGRLDVTSADGKVVGVVARTAAAAGVPVWAIVGQSTETPSWLAAVEQASPSGPGPDPAGDVVEAAARLATTVGAGDVVATGRPARG